MGDFKAGDRVKVTMEGVVRAANEVFVSVNDNEGRWLGEVNYLKSSVEKIEPPVEVFKPGDVVRIRGWEGEGGLIHLAHGGYINEYHTLFQRDREWMEKEFTSKRYEKVDL